MVVLAGIHATTAADGVESVPGASPANYHGAKLSSSHNFLMVLRPCPPLNLCEPLLWMVVRTTPLIHTESSHRLAAAGAGSGPMPHKTDMCSKLMVRP